MYQRIPKIFSIILVLFIILNTFSFLFLNLAWTSSLAAEPKFKIPDLQIDIFKDFTFSSVSPCPDDSSKMCVNWIGEHITNIYKYGIGIVGILATVVMMFGGVMWIVAGGNATRIGEAKAWIGAALTGLVLALTSYVILYQINPSITQFKPIEVSVAKKITYGCCLKDGVATNGKTESECVKDGGSWGGEGTIKYHQTNKTDKCLTQSEIEDLQFCCIRTETTGNNTITSCSDKTKSNCQPSEEPGVTQIIMTEKCSSYPDKCQSSNDCTGKAEGDQCGENKICKNISGVLKCEPCSPIGGPCGLGCCSGLECFAGPNYCISQNEHNCQYKTNGTSCKTNEEQDGVCDNDKCYITCNGTNDGAQCGDEKVCFSGTCQDCEQDIGGWCSSDICCSNLCCDKNTFPDSCKIGALQTGTKYCE